MGKPNYKVQESGRVKFSLLKIIDVDVTNLPRILAELLPEYMGSDFYDSPFAHFVGEKAEGGWTRHQQGKEVACIEYEIPTIADEEGALDYMLPEVSGFIQDGELFGYVTVPVPVESPQQKYFAACILNNILYGAPLELHFKESDAQDFDLGNAGVIVPIANPTLSRMQQALNYVPRIERHFQQFQDDIFEVLQELSQVHRVYKECIGLGDSDRMISPSKKSYSYPGKEEPSEPPLPEHLCANSPGLVQSQLLLH